MRVAAAATTIVAFDDISDALAAVPAIGSVVAVEYSSRGETRLYSLHPAAFDAALALLVARGLWPAAQAVAR